MLCPERWRHQGGEVAGREALPVRVLERVVEHTVELEHGRRRPPSLDPARVELRELRRFELREPNAPRANSIVPAASAVVVDPDGRILLHRRTDNELWSILGGGMEIGETIVREVQEETGLKVEPERLVGIYTNPRQVTADDDGRGPTAVLRLLRLPHRRRPAPRPSRRVS